MAESKGPKERTLTIRFRIDNEPGLDKMWEELKKAAKNYKVPKEQMALVALFEGLGAAKRKFQQEYEQRRQAGSHFFKVPRPADNRS